MGVMCDYWRQHALSRPLHREEDSDGRQSDSQKKWQEAVTAAGYAYAVVRSLEEFRALIEDYLKAGGICTYASRESKVVASNKSST